MATPLNLRPAEETSEAPAGGRQKALVLAVVAGLSVFLVAPLAALAGRSFAPGDPLAYYRELFVNRTSSIFYVPPGVAIRNSVFFALLTVGMALAIGLITAYLLARGRGRLARILDPIVLLPLGTSAVTLGFGYILAMGHAPLDLRASPVLVPIAHTLVAFPFVVRTLLPALRGLNPALARGRGRRLALRPGRSGARWSCRSSAAPCWSARFSPSPSAWASSAPRC